MALAVACRLETVLFWGCCFLPTDLGLASHAAVYLGHDIPLLLLSSMQLPGDGEYWDSIAHNWWMYSYYIPYAVGLFGAVLALKKEHLLSLDGVLWLVGHHIALSTFNDFSSRHVLVTAIVVMLSWVRMFLGEQSRKWARYPLILGIVFNGSTVWANEVQIAV